MSNITVKNFFEVFFAVLQTLVVEGPKKRDDSMEYWKTTVGAYVRRKRRELEHVQKQIPVARGTLSTIENGKSNFRINSLFEVLAAVRGDVSEAFKSYVPKKLHTDHQPWHEMLQQILVSDDEDGIRLTQRALRDAFASLRRPPEKGR